MTTVRVFIVIFLTAVALGQQNSGGSTRLPASTAIAPKLPFVDYEACPGKNRPVSHVKVSRRQHVFSSPDNGKLLGNLRVGETVAAVAGANVVRQPGQAVVKGVNPNDDSLPPLQAGDVVSVYGMRDGGDVLFWAKGKWFIQYYEGIAENGACGFTDGSCSMNVVRDGESEWWMQVKTNRDLTGWVLVAKFNDEKRWSNSFTDICRLD